MPEVQTLIQKAPSIKHQPISKRYYFDVALGSVCLTGADTGGAYCLLEVSLAPGIGVPRHIHTREDETYYVTSGELEVIIGDEVFVLKAGDTLYLQYLVGKGSVRSDLSVRIWYSDYLVYFQYVDGFGHPLVTPLYS